MAGVGQTAASEFDLLPLPLPGRRTGRGAPGAAAQVQGSVPFSDVSNAVAALPAACSGQPGPAALDRERRLAIASALARQAVSLGLTDPPPSQQRQRQQESHQALVQGQQQLQQVTNQLAAQTQALTRAVDAQSRQLAAQQARMQAVLQDVVQGVLFVANSARPQPAPALVGGSVPGTVLQAASPAPAAVMASQQLLQQQPPGPAALLQDLGTILTQRQAAAKAGGSALPAGAFQGRGGTPRVGVQPSRVGPAPSPTAAAAAATEVAPASAPPPHTAASPPPTRPPPTTAKEGGPRPVWNSRTAVAEEQARNRRGGQRLDDPVGPHPPQRPAQASASTAAQLLLRELQRVRSPQRNRSAAAAAGGGSLGRRAPKSKAVATGLATASGAGLPPRAGAEVPQPQVQLRSAARQQPRQTIARAVASPRRPESRVAVRGQPAAAEGVVEAEGHGAAGAAPTLRLDQQRQDPPTSSRPPETWPAGAQLPAAADTPPSTAAAAAAPPLPDCRGWQEPDVLEGLSEVRLQELCDWVAEELLVQEFLPARVVAPAAQAKRSGEIPQRGDLAGGVDGAALCRGGRSTGSSGQGNGSEGQG